MANTAIGNLANRASHAAQLSRHAVAVARPHRAVAIAGDQKHGWALAIDMIDRHGVRIVAAMENVDIFRFFHGQEIVWPRNADPPSDPIKPAAMAYEEFRLRR